MCYYVFIMCLLCVVERLAKDEECNVKGLFSHVVQDGFQQVGIDVFESDFRLFRLAHPVGEERAEVGTVRRQQRAVNAARQSSFS